MASIVMAHFEEGQIFQTVFSSEHGLNMDYARYFVHVSKV